MSRRDISRLQMKARHLEMLRALLAQQAPQAEVWAYGSRVSGGAHEGSDLDIVLRDPADPKAEIKNWMDVEEAVQESDLPMLVDVHDWAHLPAEFHRNIEREYVVIRDIYDL
jgi:predicted nucleotidyltransferase